MLEGTLPSWPFSDAQDAPRRFLNDLAASFSESVAIQYEEFN